MDRFTGALTELVQRMSQSSQAVEFRGDAVPTFNPEDRNQDVAVWCVKLDELRAVFGWTEETTIYYAVSKLRGLAQTWYKGLPSIQYTWAEWKQQLHAAFPYKRDYCERLKEMLARTKRNDETYIKYYYEKAAMLNGCKLYGEDAVSCLIGGLTDPTVKATARAANHTCPESLYSFLQALAVDTGVGPRNAPPSYKQSAYKRFETGKEKRYRGHKQSYQQGEYSGSGKISQSRTSMQSTVVCFGCGERGHMRNHCPKWGSFPTNSRCQKCARIHQSGTKCPTMGRQQSGNIA